MALDQKRWHLNCSRFRERSLYLSHVHLQLRPPYTDHLDQGPGYFLPLKKSFWIQYVCVCVWWVKGNGTSQESYNP